MKVKMAIWIDTPANLPKWFEPKKEIDITPEQIVELFESGANIMLRHDNDCSLLFVDSRAFTQR